MKQKQAKPPAPQSKEICTYSNQNKFEQNKKRNTNKKKKKKDGRAICIIHING